jgi:hypothetical protein
MLFLLLAPSLFSAADWTLLPFPRAVHADAAPPTEGVLLDASHLDVDGSFRPPALEVPDPLLPPAVFQQMLDEMLRQRGQKLETRPQAGLLFARGDAAALETARALVADLDRQTAALYVDLTVALKSGDGSPATWTRRVRAGEDAFFGARGARLFVASFDVQVAQDAGQAEPRLGTAIEGTGVHVRALRVEGGTRVLVDGVLDVARIARVERFDPETVDLGVLEQPHVVSTQIAFAGAVASGAPLEVRLAGAGPGTADLVLVVQATARPDVAGADDGFALLDVGFAGAPLRPWIAPDPGLGLQPIEHDAGLATAFLTPSAVAALLEGERGAGEPRAGRAQVFWTSSLLVLPRSDSARVAGARALGRAVESARTTTKRVTLSSGPFVASFPVAAGRPARLVSGVERPYLFDYGLEVAPQVWMPAPRVERTFDGICADLRLEGNAVDVVAWRSATDEVVTVDRDAAQTGRLEMPRRSRTAGRGRLEAGGPALRLFDAGTPLTVSTEAP